MKTQLIKFQDGTYVEVKSQISTPQKLSSKHATDIKTHTIDKINDFLFNVTKPVINAWKRINEQAKVEQIERQFIYNQNKSQCQHQYKNTFEIQRLIVDAGCV